MFLPDKKTMNVIEEFATKTEKQRKKKRNEKQRRPEPVKEVEHPSVYSPTLAITARSKSKMSFNFMTELLTASGQRLTPLGLKILIRGTYTTIDDQCIQVVLKLKKRYPDVFVIGEN